MKKRKIFTAILAAVIAASGLSGCSKESESSSVGSKPTAIPISADSAASGDADPESRQPMNSQAPAEASSAASEASAVSSSAEDSEPSEPMGDTADFLVGLDGKPILRSSITTVFSNNGEDCDPEDLTEENFSAVLCEGFTYLDSSPVPSYNSIDNADIFDEDSMTFEGVDFNTQKGYVRLNDGDRAGDLILESSEVNFALGSNFASFELADGTTKTGGELGLPEIYFNYSSARFSGSFTLKGYACCIAEDDYNISAGDILFVPTNDDFLPKMCYRLSGDDGFHYKPRIYSINGFTWTNEYGYILLGNALGVSADISGLPEDGSFTEVTVTAENLFTSCSVERMTTVSAELVDISYYSPASF